MNKARTSELASKYEFQQLQLQTDLKSYEDNLPSGMVPHEEWVQVILAVPHNTITDVSRGWACPNAGCRKDVIISPQSSLMKHVSTTAHDRTPW